MLRCLPSSLLIGSVKRNKLNFEKANKQILIDDGDVLNPKEYRVQLLVQEIQFFLQLRKQKVDEKQQLEEQINAAKESNESEYIIDDLKSKLTAANFSIGFLDNKISVPWYELKCRNDKKIFMHRLYSKIQLDENNWNDFLNKENLVRFVHQAYQEDTLKVEILSWQLYMFILVTL